MGGCGRQCSLQAPASTHAGQRRSINKLSRGAATEAMQWSAASCQVRMACLRWHHSDTTQPHVSIRAGMHACMNACLAVPTHTHASTTSTPLGITHAHACSTPPSRALHILPPLLALPPLPVLPNTCIYPPMYVPLPCSFPAIFSHKPYLLHGSQTGIPV